MHEQKLK